MQIVHVVRQFAPGIGGLENSVHCLSARQAQAGHHVRVVTLDRLFGRPDVTLPKTEVLQGVEVVRIPFVGSQRYPIAPKVLKHLGDADIVHVHAVDFLFDFLALTAFIHGKPMVITPHGGFFHTAFLPRAKQLYFNTVTRLLIRKYAQVISLSEHDRELFLPIRKDGLFCCDYGIDTLKFDAAAAREPTRRIVTISRFSSNKRHDRLFAFLRALREREPEWSMAVVGSEYDFSADDLRAMAEKAGVAGAVEIHVRPSDKDIRGLMSECSVAASASEYEGFGIAAVEAMSAGLIPVLSPLPSYTGMIEKAKLGLILDYGSPAAAADLFLQYWRDITPNYSQVREGLIRASRKYDWSEVAQKVEAIYRDVLSQRPRPLRASEPSVPRVEE